MLRWLGRVVVGLVLVGGGAAMGSSLWSSASAAPAPDAAYTAVTPCVGFDSRAAQGATGGFVGPINGGQAVTYQVTGTFPVGQGGGNTTCGIPAGATSVEINVVAVNALNEGNLRVSDGSPVTTGGIVNYNALAPAKLNTSSTAIIPLDATGHLVVTPNCGVGCTVDSTDVRGVVLGYFTSSLATRVAAVEAKLASVSVIPTGVGGQPTIRFSGVNVQLVNGTGSTYTTNGRGNLVLGYAGNTFGETRTGSHDLVIGDDSGWTAAGGAVLGESNGIAGRGATVLGGHSNAATGDDAVVVGGFGNGATGQESVVTGGESNFASGSTSTVTGGSANTASGQASSVSGGADNTASGTTCVIDDFELVPASAVSGGRNNTASGCYSSVSGGGGSDGSSGNASPGDYSSVSAGETNTASGISASVAGGWMNEASKQYATVSGGLNNHASGPNSSVSGGVSNTASGTNSSVSGGLNHEAASTYNWRAGDLFESD
jgi:hypothetical protein